MSATQDPLKLEGLTCPQCRYDLRGLRGFRCPECGSRFNPFALRRQPDRRIAHSVAFLCMFMAVVTSLWIIWNAWRHTLGYVHSQWGWCGTTSAMHRYALEIGMIYYVILIVIALLGAWRVKHAFRITRLFALTSLPFWAFCWLTVNHDPFGLIH